LLEGDTVVHAVVVVPPLADARGGEPPDEEDIELGKPLFVKVEVDNKAETIPLELRRTSLTTGKLTDRITHRPRSREGRRKLGEGIDVLTQDLWGGLPVVEGKSESNLLLESDVADKNGSVEGSRTGPRERQALDVNVGMRVGGVWELSAEIGIENGEGTLNWCGRRGGWLWEGVSGRFCLGFGFRLFTSRSRYVSGLAGPFVDSDGFETIVRLCEVDVFEEVGGSGSRLSADVSNLGDVGRGGRRLERRLERFAIGEDDRRRSVPGNWGPHNIPWLSRRQRRKQWRGRWERNRITGGWEREEEGGRTFLCRVVVVGLFLLVLLLIEVEHGLFLRGLAFGHGA
jgi:hypothetical protein